MGIVDIVLVGTVDSIKTAADVSRTGPLTVGALNEDARAKTCDFFAFFLLHLIEFLNSEQ